MNVLQRIDRALGRMEGWFLVFFLALMVILTFLQVVLRAFHIYGHFHWANALMGRLDWAGPLARLLVLWAAFLGASLLTGENKHIKIDLMSEVLPLPWLPFRELLLSAACMVVTAFMVEASFSYVRMEWTFGGRMFLDLPNWIGQLILPVGFCLMLFRFFLTGLIQAVRLFGGGRR